MKCVGLLGGECLHQCLIVNAVSGLAVGLVLVDRSGKLVWLNRTAEKLLGVELNGHAGKPIQRVLKTPEVAAFWQDARRAEDNTFAELTVHWPRELELKINATRCVDGAGREIGRALLLCDVTQERSLQVSLSQAMAKHLMALTSSHLPPQPVHSLTSQELRVFRLLGRGLGNDQIAAQTNISPSTVRSHLKSVYKKLKLRSRAEAVSFAVRHHLA